VVQINILIDTFFASFIPGAITYLYFANRLMQFPLGVYGIAVATASFPTLAGHFTREDGESFSHTYGQACRSIFFILCPATFALLFFGRDIVALLFHHGQFRSGGSLGPTAAALFAYASGLTVFALVKLSATAIHATGNTRGPMWAGVAAVVLNVFLDWLLVRTPLKHVGLALATVCAGVLNLSLLLILLRPNLRKGTASSAFSVLLRSVALAIVTIGAGLLLASSLFPWGDPSDPGTLRAGLRVLIGCGAGGVLYFAGAFKVMEPEIRSLLTAFRRRKGT
jgi:putative peptidoglycan lipid II flippase